MIYIISSNRPFRLYNEQDVIDILAFLGMVEDRFRIVVIRSTWSYCFSCRNWVLKCCYVNKDVDVSRVAQITLPDLQIPFVDKALRAYVKPMDEKSIIVLNGHWHQTRLLEKL